MISGEVLKYLNRFLLAIPKNYEDLFDQSSFSDNTLPRATSLLTPDALTYLVIQLQTNVLRLAGIGLLGKLVSIGRGVFW
jgi:hypothetical protein